MNLTREQKRKRAEVKIKALESKIERVLGKLPSQLKEARAELESLEFIGFRVIFESRFLHNPRVVDYTIRGWSTLNNASNHADEIIEAARKQGIVATKHDLFNDTPRESWEFENE